MSATETPSPSQVALGEFLRASRARVRPADVGLPDDGRPRRVPGLRREELAQRANVSIDYIMRLEQGRTISPSHAVLTALADALCLPPDARDYLMTVADAARNGPRHRLPDHRIRPATQQLLEHLAELPAMVVGRGLDVLAWNTLAAALFTDFAALPDEHRNMVRLTFLDPTVRALYTDWATTARRCVSHLRFDAGRYPDDPRLAALVDELSTKDSDFRSWWGSHQVSSPPALEKSFLHHVVGPIALHSQRYAVDGEPDQYLVVYTAQPASAAHETLRLLASWSGERAWDGQSYGDSVPAT